MAYRKGKSRDNCMSIPQFFAGKTIFITGGTGFMGKVLIEKLLRSCPEIKKIYILMRSKGGKTMEERLKDLIALPIFVKVKRQDDQAIHKLVPISGDVCEPMLGLSEQDQNLLIEEVSVIFHVAASVRFDDALKKAVLMNTRGTYETVKLAQKMKKLETFLHTSTTYCNTHKDIIEEKVYPAPANWKQIVKIAENTDSSTLEVFCHKILGFYPNTYTYTKGLAEHVILEHGNSIPAVIFRPSIVVSSVLEPLPGWIDNFNGPVGLIVASGKGIMKTVYTDPDIRPDYIPVDLAVKAMIAAAWNRATSTNEDFQEVPVYNCSADKVKRITQQETIDIGTYVTQEIPLNDILWVTRTEATKYKYIHYIKVFFFHFLPALALDSAFKLMKRKPMLLKIQRKIFLANLALEYFLMRQWTFKHDRCFALNFRILEEDIPQFSFYVNGDFDVVEYYRNCAFGARQYLLKEDNTDLPQARKHQQRMYWVDKFTRLVFLAILAYIVIKFHLVQKIQLYIYFLISSLVY